MKHLTVDEIIAFVSLTEFNDEAIRISASVHGHIRQCDKCLKLVKAFQLIYDEFTDMHIRGDFHRYAMEKALKEPHTGSLVRESAYLDYDEL